ncbi:NAD(P)H-binding protein [Corynebacterium variabile]|uniref:NAD(P)H-binding protein n=1 Tax=Corynebacterium variabile TaxID=1727 RepID=UPI003F9B4E40
MTILVTAATGHLGRLVIDRLIARGADASDIVAGVRTPAKAADLAEKGVQVRNLDYDKPASIPAALEGIDRVLLISSPEIGSRVPQHTAVVDAAAAAGVQLLAYTSCGEALTTDFMLAPEHKATEEAIHASGVPFTVLRNVWYIENYLPNAAQVKETGVLLGAAGAGRVAAATRKDYADAAAVVYQDLPAERYRAGLEVAGLDEGTIGFLAGLADGIATGGLDIESPALAELIGHEPTTFAEGIRAALAGAE